MLMMLATAGYPQRKSARPAKRAPTPTPAASELSKLRDEYVKATNDYKASLRKLLALYQEGVKKAEARRDKSQSLFAQGLISKHDLEDAERTVTDANLKVSGVQQQIGSADTQIAQTLVEVEGEKQLAKLGPIRRGSLVRTTSFVRYNCVRHRVCAQAGAVAS